MSEKQATLIIKKIKHILVGESVVRKVAKNNQELLDQVFYILAHYEKERDKNDLCGVCNKELTKNEQSSSGFLNENICYKCREARANERLAKLKLATNC